MIHSSLFFTFIYIYMSYIYMSYIYIYVLYIYVLYILLHHYTFLYIKTIKIYKYIPERTADEKTCVPFAFLFTLSPWLPWSLEAKAHPNWKLHGKAFDVLWRQWRSPVSLGKLVELSDGDKNALFVLCCYWLTYLEHILKYGLRMAKG